MNARKNNLITGSLIVALSLVVLLSSQYQANADPTGTKYEVTTRNAPNSGSGGAAFDHAGFETIPGTGIDIDEHFTPFDGGELLEYWVKTTSGEPFVLVQDDRELPSEIWVEGIRWLDKDGGDVPGFFVPDSAYIYFTANGEPLPMGNPFGLNIVFAPHPIFPNIMTVLVGNDREPSNALHLSTEILDDGATFIDVFAALELNPEVVNDFHFGVLVRHVPEPGTLVLGVFGLLFAAAMSRRRRIRG